MEKRHISFKTKARTVNLLGKENVLDYRSAVIELVKNSFDAFSSFSEIQISNDEIVIADAGNGMTMKEIESAYFTLGTDNKLKNSKNQIGDDIRVMNGSMGIGRLSLGRLGKKSYIHTCNGEKAYKFEIDWQIFDSTKDLEGIQFEIAETSISDFLTVYSDRNIKNNKNKGTIIISTELYENWDDDELDLVKKINDGTYMRKKNKF